MARKTRGSRAVVVGAALAVVASLLGLYLLELYRIPSSAMEPTLHCARPGDGCRADRSDRIAVYRFTGLFGGPDRGDVVVFETPPGVAERCGAGGTFVKRVVGLPGDRVAERNGVILLNGRRLREPYVRVRGNLTFPARRVPRGHYFVLGDNRRASCDSRVWGPLPEENLIGEVFAVYWPPGRIGIR